MWLVLCHSEDVAALWAYRGLQARGVRPLELVTAEELACALRWEHRLGESGFSLTIELADGRCIRGHQVRGVLNRLHSLPLYFWRSAEAKDRDYVQQEIQAFTLSWLHSLRGRTLNPATPLGACGAWRSAVAWNMLAQKAGLPTAGCQGGERQRASGTSDSVSVIVVGGQVIGRPVPATIAAGCAALAALSETPVLGIDFCGTDGDAWEFSGASPWPDLRLGGGNILDALRVELGAWA
jgi:hypothetical protein